jgi:hypothetical protein
MIRSRRSVLTVLTILFLFFLPLILSCAGPDPEEPTEKPPFIGLWDVQETRTGCGEEIEFNYTVEIKQNNNIFSLAETTGKFQDTCRLNSEDVLLCGGEFRYSDGYYSYNNESYNIWFNDENDDNKLIGTGDWTYHPQDGDACNGGSGLSAIRVNN